MKIVCLSDTHNAHNEIAVPDGDLLIHAGDAVTSGTINELQNFIKWFDGLPHKRKVLIAGNHDWAFQLQPDKALELIPPSIVYLQDSWVEIDGFKIYGSPWQPRFFDWAFNLMRGAELAEKWAMIPDDINILITHGPPNGILDEVPRQFGIENTGCEELRKRVDTLAAKDHLKLHIFGHIHCGYGKKEVNGVTFINASNCDEQYTPSQPPIIIEL